VGGAGSSTKAAEAAAAAALLLGEEEEEEEEEKKNHSLFPLSPPSFSSLTSTAASFPSHSAGCSIDIGGNNLCSSVVSGGLAGDGVAVAGISFRSFPGGGEEAPEGDRSEGGKRVVGWGEGGETERGGGGGKGIAKKSGGELSQGGRACGGLKLRGAPHL